MSKIETAMQVVYTIIWFYVCMAIVAVVLITLGVKGS